MKTFYRLTIGLLFSLVVILGFQTAQKSDKLNIALNENRELVEKSYKDSLKNDSLRKRLDKAEAKIKEIQPIVNNVKEQIGATGLTDAQLGKAVKISKTTKLSLEGSVALVKYSDMMDIDYDLVLSLIEVESNFNQFLVGRDSDRGYMQIIPGTEKYLVERFGAELGVEYDPSRIFDADYNLALGIKYIDHLSEVHGNDLDKILTEYNRGPYGLASYYSRHNTYQTIYSQTVLSKKPKYLALNN